MQICPMRQLITIMGCVPNHKIEINKRVLGWYKNVIRRSMFYKRNGYVLRLVSFPSKSLKNEWGLKGLDAGVTCDLIIRVSCLGFNTRYDVAYYDRYKNMFYVELFLYYLVQYILYISKKVLRISQLIMMYININRGVYPGIGKFPRSAKPTPPSGRLTP